MKNKKNLFIRILLYGTQNPLAFLGFSCWAGMIPLGILDGALGWDLPWLVYFFRHNFRICFFRTISKI